MSETGTGMTAMLRFHLGSGVRLSLRAFVPLMTVGVAVIGLDAQPAEMLARLARGLGGRPGDPATLIVLFVLSTAIASWAAPRVTRGLGGWPRHLPVSGVAHRRAACYALVVAQAPLAIAAFLLMAAAIPLTPAVSLPRLAGLPLLVLGAAIAALPVRRRTVTSILGVAAAGCAVMGSWVLLLLGVAAVCLSDRIAGPLAVDRTVRRYEGSRRLESVLTTHLRIVGRAVGGRVLGPLVTSMLPVAGLAVFIANNDLAPGVSTRAARLAGGLSITFLMAGLSDLIAFRRPAWPWSRSLPLSSARRVAFDALLLCGVTAAPIAAIASIEPVAAPLLCALALLLSLRAAGMMRRAGGLRAGAGGRLFAEGFVLSGLLCLLPWLGWLLVPAALPSWRAAARQERRQKVSRWLEMHHLAAGDPLSWSAE